MNLKNYGFVKISNKNEINTEMPEDIIETPVIDSIDIYTDGACFNNGKSNAKAGIGVYIPQYDIQISERIQGKQSNNTAEIKALIKAIELVKNDAEDKKLIHIYSDSEYSIKCASSYGRKLEQSNWSLKDRRIPNLQLVKELYYLYKPYKNIRLIHIRAHTGLNDTHSKGNEMADLLARKSIGQYHKSKKKNKIRVYFSISYSQKEEFKSYGGQWDKEKKMWYVYEDNQHIEFLKMKF